MTPTLVVITGLPCSGKTTVGRRLAADLGLAFLTKDGLKERLFDRLGWSDRAWSKRLSLAAFDLLHHVAEAELAAGRGLVVEGNFDPAVEGARWRELVAARGAAAVQVVLTAPPDVLVSRFRARAGRRHPGHVDRESLPELEARLRSAPPPPLDLPGPVLTRHTGEPGGFDLEGLAAAVRRVLAGG